MKNNQVYLDPHNPEDSMQQLQRFYRLDAATLARVRRVVERYPKPVILYVDEANAPLHARSILDDQFTFDTTTGELVLFSADPMTFIDAIIEMWMFVQGFETLMGDDDYWKVEMAIGCWKVVKDNIKEALDIPINQGIQAIVGLPPAPEDRLLEDAYPFRTMVSKFDLVSFTQMVRLAGRDYVRVSFPAETDRQVMDAYQMVRRFRQEVGDGLGIQDVEEFNRRLMQKIERLVVLYRPHELPIPLDWLNRDDGHEAASGEMDPSPNSEDTAQHTALLLGPPSDEADDLLSAPAQEEPATQETRLMDQRLQAGPFGDFIDSLFDD